MILDLGEKVSYLLRIIIKTFQKKSSYVMTVVISQKINSKRRMKVSDITLLGQGDRALILSLDNKDYLFISGKNSGALLTEVKKTNEFKTNNLEKVIEKRLSSEIS